MKVMYEIEIRELLYYYLLSLVRSLCRAHNNYILENHGSLSGMPGSFFPFCFYTVRVTHYKAQGTLAVEVGTICVYRSER